MINRIVGATAIAFVLLASGCTTVTAAGYYWGNYSKTLYGYAKTPSDQTLTAHVHELERIVAESEKRGLRVPPGIHAELGYLKARGGDASLATAHYESEVRLYPEARPFLDRLAAASAQKKSEP